MECDANQRDSATASIETDVLVVGAGPAGASLACFLAQNDIKGLIISQASSTARRLEPTIQIEEAPILRGLEAELRYLESTFPGSRLPHAWLRAPQKDGPGGPMVSTHDLAGKGQFSLFTGLDGKAGWTEAAKEVSQTLQVEIAVYSIGWRQDYEDVFFDWGKKREVGEKGAVLVRPDRTVAWQSVDLPAPTEISIDKLGQVMRCMVSRGPLDMVVAGWDPVLYASCSYVSTD